MATIQEIKKALKSDPDLLNRIPGLKDFVDKNRDQFDFLFKNQPSQKPIPPKSKNNNGRTYMDWEPGDYTGSNGTSGGSPILESETTEEYSKRWNPKITQI